MLKTWVKSSYLLKPKNKSKQAQNHLYLAQIFLKIRVLMSTINFKRPFKLKKRKHLLTLILKCLQKVGSLLLNLMLFHLTISKTFTKWKNSIPIMKALVFLKTICHQTLTWMKRNLIRIQTKKKKLKMQSNLKITSKNLELSQ